MVRHDSGALFHSRDGGMSWQFVQSLWDEPGRKEVAGRRRRLLSRHPLDLRRSARRCTRTLAVSCGGVWRTRDRGASWEVLCQRDARCVHASRPTGRSLYSGSALHGAVSRYARCAVGAASQRHLPIGGWLGELDRDRGAARRASDLWFCRRGAPAGCRDGVVPASAEGRAPPAGRGQVVMTRTRDGGKTFETLRRGLPQGARLRHRLSARPGHRRQRRAPAVWQHHRRTVDQRGWR